MYYLSWVAWIIGAYLLGSLSSAVIVSCLMDLPDPRTTGSRNPGATNVLRISGRKSAALLTLFGDALKGFLPVWLVVHEGQADPILSVLVLLGAFWGHLFPLFFNFEGGKGVATALGGLLALSWPLGLVMLGTWLLVVVVTRISSLGALIAFTALPAYALYEFSWPIAALLGVLSACLMLRHRENMLRLCAGQEKKLF